MATQVVHEVRQADGSFAVVRQGMVLGQTRGLGNGAWIGAPVGDQAMTFARREAAFRYVFTSISADSRWQRALGRAIEEGIDPVEVAGMAGTWFCESGTQPGVGYLVTRERCSCPAGDKDMPCKHRAAVLAILGRLVELEAFDPEPEPPAPAASAIPGPKVTGGDACPRCKGKGWWYYHVSPTGQHSSAECQVCGGTGAARVPLAA